MSEKEQEKSKWEIVEPGCRVGTLRIPKGMVSVQGDCAILFPGPLSEQFSLKSGDAFRVYVKPGQGLLSLQRIEENGTGEKFYHLYPGRYGVKIKVARPMKRLGKGKVKGYYPIRKERRGFFVVDLSERRERREGT